MGEISTGVRWLDTKSAADYTQLSESLLEKMRTRKDGPQFSRVGRAIRYRSDWLDDFMTARCPNRVEAA